MTTWSHSAMLDLCARLRLACEALSRDAGHPITPADIRLEDLAADQRDRLLREAVPDVWAYVHEIQRTNPLPQSPTANLKGPR